MARARASDWLEVAVEALPVAVVVVESGGTVVAANGRARDVFFLCPGDEAPESLRRLAGAVRDHDRLSETLDLPVAPGATVLAEVRAVAIAGGAVLTIDDLTERGQRERADRDFITNAAHQLRTPITGIATAIEVLQGGAKELPDVRDHFLGHIERQTERLVRLVRAMLVLARAERGDIGPTLGLVPLQPVLAGLVDELPAKAGVAVEVDCPATAAVVADEALLSEALANLIGNALEHTAAGSVRIVVTETEEEEPAGVTIEIVDTGTGIESAELGRVFERFRRGTAERDGAGLGLPIARAAIEAQGGTLELDSQPARGTTARVRLAGPAD
jgi:signal transduction histidine kinase